VRRRQANGRAPLPLIDAPHFQISQLLLWPSDWSGCAGSDAGAIPEGRRHTGEKGLSRRGLGSGRRGKGAETAMKSACPMW